LIELDQQQLTVTIVNSFIAQYAPDEMLLLPDIAETFQRDPRVFRKGQKEKEDLLGFGPADLSTLLTPIVLLITSAVLGALAEKSAKTFVDQVAKILTKIFARSHAKKTLQIAESGLTKEQLAVIHETALDQAHKLKFSEARTKQLADAIVAHLATSQKTNQP